MAAQTGQLDYEDKHVHQVYEEIASHFSATRYKVALNSLLRLPLLTTTDSRGRWWIGFYVVYLLDLSA